MILDQRSAFTLGVGYGPLPMAMLGLWPVEAGEPAVPPAPTFGVGGGRTYGTGRTVRPRYLRDDELIWLGGGRR